MRTNVRAVNTEKTHEGAPPARMNPTQALRRSVLSCLLWEAEFYEDGKTIADRIMELAQQAPAAAVADLAREARQRHNLRHAPLMLALAMVKRGGVGAADTVADVIQRADELSEIVAMFWRDGRRMLPKQLKRGLAKAFLKFDEYALAKYNGGDRTVKLRDVLFMSHAHPLTRERAALWKRLVDGKLATPDTWEVALSGGSDKRAAFERLILERKLGYLALLRNLRNMAAAGCDESLVKEAIVARRGAERVLPFRYVAAARACPQFEPAIDQALCEAIGTLPSLPGKTIVLVDVSGSMDVKLSGKSDLTRVDAAAALASIIHGDLRVFSFSEDICEVPARRGMAGIDAVMKSQPHGGTRLGAAVSAINGMKHDRLIVITDEQSADRVPDPVATHAYMINVASAKNGVGYGRWTHIDGFSESVLRFIYESEAME